jgi:hypothetical protein
VVLWLLIRAGQLTDLRAADRGCLPVHARITAMVVFILIGSTCFSVVFQGVDGGAWVEHLFTSLPGGWIGFLIVVNLFIFFLAFFLDFFEIAFIVCRCWRRLRSGAGPGGGRFDGRQPRSRATAALVWFGVMLCVNMQTSFMHRRSALRCSTCAASPRRKSRLGHLLGRPAVGGPAARHGAAGDVLAGHGDWPARQGIAQAQYSAEVSIPLGGTAASPGGRPRPGVAERRRLE